LLGKRAHAGKLQSRIVEFNHSGRSNGTWRVRLIAAAAIWPAAKTVYHGGVAGASFGNQ
jgi:hypothetical protein